MILALDEIAQFRDLCERVNGIGEAAGRDAIDQLEEGRRIIEEMGVPERMYLNASDKQRHLCDQFHNRELRLIAAVGGNRSGKSVLTVFLCAGVWLRDVAPGGAVVWFISQNDKKSKHGVQKMLWECLPKNRFTKKWDGEVGFGRNGVTRFRTADGGMATILFMNEEQEMDVFETDAVDLVVWDEASKEPILSRLRSRVVDKEGIILISTLPEHIWLDFRIKRSVDPKWVFEQFSAYDNEHNLPPGEIETWSANLTPEERALRIDGDFTQLKGLIVPEYVPTLEPEGNQCDDFYLPADWPAWVFIDVGIYTAAALCTVGPDEKRYVLDEVYTTNCTVAENASAIKGMLERHGCSVGRVKSFKIDPQAWAVTPANQITVGQQYANAGIPNIRWTPVQEIGWQAVVNQLRLAFRRHQIAVCQRCEYLSHELQTWRFRMDDMQKIDIREKREAGHDHCIDCVKSWNAENPTFVGYEAMVYDTAPDLEYGQELDDEFAR